MKTPMYSQNKGYESNAQEKKNLMKMPGAFKQMSPISKHMSTPMPMGGSKMKGGGMPMNNPIKKTEKQEEQDYSRNAIADYKAGDTKDANYEKKKALELDAGEGR